ncbi:MAG: dihydropteroate synthase [Deltaproteobacteria bacterium]|nr:dihydropteroate synthase [Deltaproteobacteria bacterium]
MQLVADNLHIVNSSVWNALKKLNPEPIKELVTKCEMAGAGVIDINSGPLTRNPVERMTFLVETVQSVTNLPVMIDTANPVAMEAGLKANKKTAIINGFSLEPVKLEQILPLAKKYKVDIIGYLLYPDGRVPNASERFSLAIEILQAIENQNIDQNQLIIDPVIVPLSWQNGSKQAGEILDVIQNLPDILGFPVKTVAGLSNLTSGHGYKEKRLLLERTYLPMLASAGLSMALLNIFHDKTIEVERACGPLVNPEVFSWAEL